MEDGFWRGTEDAVVLYSEHPIWKLSRRVTSLSVSSSCVQGMNQTASCDGWSWKLSAREVFKAVQVHRQLLPSKIDASAALKDCSLVQSLGTEIEAQPWQSNGDMTHHRRIIWREGRWKTQSPYSISPVYWKCRMRTKLVGSEYSKAENLGLFIHGTTVCSTVHFVFTDCCLMCWIAQHPSGSQNKPLKKIMA